MTIERTQEEINEEEQEAAQRYFGKYRGVVLNNIDPEQRGRIMAIVPDISSVIPTTWALPCLPTGGIQMGIFAVPIIGAGVWIEFEQGDPDYPIWTGCFYGTFADVPMLSRQSPLPLPSITMQTPLQNGINISDTPPTPVTGGIVIKSTTNAMIVVNDSGIYISNGKGAMITLIGPSIDFNGGALTILK